MTILLTGGGSGGHITPLLAVARELKRQSPGVRLHYVGERGSSFSHLLDGNLFDKQSRIFAGKFRRYHGESWLRRLTDIKTIAYNLRDLVLVGLGFFESLAKLAVSRPDVIFIKGGYVGLPLGLAARLLRIPYITHDSDAVPGLTNRLIGRGAAVNTVGIRGGFYGYPKDKVQAVGIPVREGFTSLSAKDKKEAKRKLGLPEDARVLLITGGSQGARRINQSLAKVIPDLLDRDSHLRVVHQLGKGNMEQYGSFDHPRLEKKDFIDKLHIYSAAADLIITRAGASTLAEYAAQEKALVVVPSPYLTGGHQLRNAEVLHKAEAAKVVSEKELSDSEETKETILNLLNNDEIRRRLGKNLRELMIPGAAKRIAEQILRCSR